MKSSMRAAVVRLRLLRQSVGRCPQRPCSSAVDSRVTDGQKQSPPSSPVDLLRQIVANLAGAGHKMVLPESSEALEQLARPLSDLLRSGVAASFVKETFSANPALLKQTAKQTTQWTALMTTLMSSCALRADEALGMMNAYSDVLFQIGAEEVGRRTEAILSNGLSSNDMRSLFLSCPDVLLTRDARSIVHLCESLRGFFSNAMMKQLLVSHPKVLLSNLEDLQLKYEYVYFHMGIESAELLKCKNWVTMTLDDIMARHQFLVRAGIYIYPDPKKTQLEKLNPELKQILDCSEKTLATSVAGMTFEEWNVFKMIWEKEQRDKDDSDDENPPYARIKASQWKAFNRTRKPTVERGADHEFRE